MTTTAALPTLAATHNCGACRRPVRRVTTQRGSVAIVDLAPRPNGAMHPVSATRYAYLLPGERSGRDGYGLHHRGGNCLPYDGEEE